MSARVVAARATPAPVDHTPDVVAPPPGHPRFPLLDSMRAVAALAVLFGHVAAVSRITVGHWWSPLASHGDQGVAIFFILSGFLLYRPMVSAQLNGARRTRLRDYARNRFLRIVPAYWLAITVLAIWPGLPGVFSENWWYYYGFLQVYDTNIAIGGLFIAWSLCVEVTFYVVLPFYAAAVARLTRSFAVPRRIRFELVLLAVLSLAALVFRYEAPRFPLSLPIYWSWFAEGMALALLSAAWQGRPKLEPRRAVELVRRRPELCWLAAAVLYVVLCFGVGQSTTAGYTPFQDVVLHRVVGGAFALALVIPAVIGSDGGGWPRRVMAWNVLAWLGLVSYGIYLWHLKVIDELAEHTNVHDGQGLIGFAFLGVVTVAITVAIAAASYYGVERPILRLKFRGSLKRSSGRSAR
jgi:peptidoglycan/LPS O-acetylase OafA/YrhL